MSYRLLVGHLFVFIVFGARTHCFNSRDFNILVGRSWNYPANSCQQIVDLAGPLADRIDNGYYYVRTQFNGSDYPAVRKVYCKVDEERCGQKGWMRIATVNAQSGFCPTNFSIYFADRARRVCRGSRTTPGSHRGRLYTATFQLTNNFPFFTRVAAFVEGYQFGNPFAFSNARMDGITFYYGNSTFKYFLWAYAVGSSDRGGPTACPCSTVPGVQPPIGYGNCYYCDTGTSRRQRLPTWYSRRPLFTGNCCPEGSTCCAPHDLPYFCRSGLRDTTTADRFTVEVYLRDGANRTDVGISRLGIYVA